MITQRTSPSPSRAERVRARRRRSSTPRKQRAASAQRAEAAVAAAVPGGVGPSAVVSRYGLAGSVAVDAPLPRGQRRPRRAGPAARVGSPIALGWRWLSALTLLLSLAGLYALLGLPKFRLHHLQVQGLQRLDAAMLRGVLPLGEPTATVDPQEVARLLLTTFPALAQAQVALTWDGTLTIAVLERQPVLVWEYQGHRWWVDPEGVLFPVLQEEALPVVRARDLPPGLRQEEGRWTLPPEMVRALQVLAAEIPSGQPLVYDARYGLGWEAPEGWQVFVGRHPTQMPARLRVYWALREYLRGQGLRPALIDLSVLEAPYYRMEP